MVNLKIDDAVTRKGKLFFSRGFFCIGFLCVAGYGGPRVPVALAQESQQIEVTALSGDVEVLLKDAQEYAAAEEGILLEAGDLIKTGSGACAELSFNEDNSNLARLSEETNVTALFQGDEKIELTEGEVFTTVSQLSSGSAFEIRTPTAVSGARGTDWVTKVTEEGTEVEAVDSSPYVKHFEAKGTISKEETPIPPGQMTTVRNFQRPMPPKPMRQERRQKWQEMKPLLREHGQKAVMNRKERPRFDRNNFLQRSKEQKGASGMRKLDSQKSENKSPGEGSVKRPQPGRGFDSGDPVNKAERLSDKSGTGERMPGQETDKGRQRDAGDKETRKQDGNPDSFDRQGKKYQEETRPALGKGEPGNLNRANRDREKNRFENSGQGQKDRGTAVQSQDKSGRFEGSPSQKKSAPGAGGQKSGAGKPKGGAGGHKGGGANQKRR